MLGNDYETDYIKLNWKIEALRGQLAELERERNATGNKLHIVRILLLEAMTGLDVQTNKDMARMTDAELYMLFAKTIKSDWRFSRCPNAQEYRCRPSAMQITRDGDIVHCDDCGWDIRETPITIKPPEELEDTQQTPPVLDETQETPSISPDEEEAPPATASRSSVS